MVMISQDEYYGQSAKLNDSTTVTQTPTGLLYIVETAIEEQVLAHHVDCTTAAAIKTIQNIQKGKFTK